MFRRAGGVGLRKTSDFEEQIRGFEQPKRATAAAG
jgi:hypothetical protein